jgi:hypothetical protein
VCLARGAHTITIEFHQKLTRKDRREDMKRFHSGFELKYEGPDTEDCLKIVPFRRLIQNWKTTNPLEIYAPQDDVANPALITTFITSITADQFLGLQYISTLRDIRRIYQRAFKATLLERGSASRREELNAIGSPNSGLC